ncbi:hypothetical protein [Rhodococcus sp. UNC363MFTsu5.1]|uniref:hypothetical protein n=1 Tax=Rhodococcus sp. UNC363MFTsu5.1 TaxID=1449069 RepID=UPI0012DDF759|nr:hypothetical protein [Rhodococcus sp. UNC363MFTsu5.1]
MIEPARYDAVPEADRLEQTQPVDDTRTVVDAANLLADSTPAWDVDDADRIGQALSVSVDEEEHHPARTPGRGVR